MNSTDRELAEAELEHVAGGKPSAAPKQDPLPKEQVTSEYGASKSHIPSKQPMDRTRVMPNNFDRELAANELREEELASVSGGLFGLMGEILSNVSKTRNEISMTFARNAHA
jgi:bacteriocin-like protein